MANRRVSVYRYVNIGEGKYRYCRPLISKNGTYSTELVYVNEVPTRCPIKHSSKS